MNYNVIVEKGEKFSQGCEKNEHETMELLGKDTKH